MKKPLLFISFTFYLVSSNAQNVGIGTNNPQTKLDINGALSTRMTNAPASAAVTIPDNVTLFRLTATPGGSNTTLSLTNPKEGQLLIIVNEDDNDAMFNSYTIPAGTSTNPSIGNFINIGGIASGWKRTGDNNTGANSFTAGDGLSWSGNTLNSVWTQSGNDIYKNPTGNVGIGNSSPGGLLDVSAAAPNDNSTGRSIILLGQQGGTGGAATNGGNVTVNSGEGYNGGSAGSVNINSSNSTTGTVNIGAGTTSQSINLGIGSGNKTVNLGSSSGSSSTTINAGSGGVNINTLNVGGIVKADAVTGKLGIATSSDLNNAANGVFIGNQVSQQTSANFNIDGNGTLNDLTVQGNDINGANTGGALLNINSYGGVRVNLDANNDGSENFGVKDGSGSIVFQVDEIGDVTNLRNQTMSGNLTMTGAASVIQANTSLDVNSNGGADINIDNDNNGTSSEFVVKKDGGTRLFRVNEDGNTRIHNPNAPAAGGNLTVDGLSGSGTRIVTADGSGNLSATNSLSSLVPTSTTITLNPVNNQTTISGGTQDLSANRTWTIGTVQDIGTASSPTFSDLNLTGSDINSSGLLRINSTTDVRVVLDADNNGSNSFKITNNGGSTPVFSVTEGGVVYANSLSPSSAVYTDASKNLTTTAPNSGTLSFWNRDDVNNDLSPSHLSDKIGIGTASPSAMLHIQSSTTNSNGILVESTSSSEGGIAVIEARGQRGDGNQSPAFVGGLYLSALQSNQLLQGNGNATYDNLGVVAFGGNHTDASASHILYPASIAALAEGDFNTATDMPTALIFNTGSTGLAKAVVNQTIGTERMRISADGKVGIGTASPTSALDVDGKIRGTATFGYGSSSITNASTSSGTDSYIDDIQATVAVQTNDLVKVDCACNLSGSNSSTTTYMRIGLASGSASAIQSSNWITKSGTGWGGGYSTGLYKASADGNLTFKALWHVSAGIGYYVYCNISAHVIGKD